MTVICVLSVVFYLNRIPPGSTKIVDLKPEVVLCPIQPLHSETVICHPSNSGQVVLTEGKEKEKLKLLLFHCIVSHGRAKYKLLPVAE